MKYIKPHKICKQLCELLFIMNSIENDRRSLYKLKEVSFNTPNTKSFVVEIYVFVLYEYIVFSQIILGIE